MGHSGTTPVTLARANVEAARGYVACSATHVLTGSHKASVTARWASRDIGFRITVSSLIWY